MKSTAYILGFLFLIASSCKEVSEISLLDISAPVGVDFVVSSPDSLAAKEAFLDASTSADFMSNRSKIDQLEVSGIQYKFVQMGADASDSLIDGSVDYFNPTTNAFETLSIISHKKMQKDLPFELPVDATISKKMVSTITTSPYQIKLRLSGSTNKKPVDFTLNMKVNLKLKVKI